MTSALVPSGPSSRRLACGIALLALGAAGCPAPWAARLVYPPQGDRAVASVPAGAPAVALGAVADERSGKPWLLGSYERVAAVDMPMVRMDLVTDDDVPAWVRGAIRRELQLAGVNVVEAGPAAASVPVLAAAISRLSCAASDRDHRYVSRIELRAIVTDRGRTLLEKPYVARLDRGFDVIRDVTDEGIEACLATPLRDAARAIAADAARAVRAPPAPAPAATEAAPPTPPP